MEDGKRRGARGRSFEDRTERKENTVDGWKASCNEDSRGRAATSTGAFLPRFRPSPAHGRSLFLSHLPLVRSDIPEPSHPLSRITRVHGPSATRIPAHPPLNHSTTAVATDAQGWLPTLVLAHRIQSFLSPRFFVFPLFSSLTPRLRSLFGASLLRPFLFLSFLLFSLFYFVLSFAPIQTHQRHRRRTPEAPVI